jgi:hypothetical protein
VRIPQIIADTVPALGPTPQLDAASYGALVAAPAQGLSRAFEALGKAAEQGALVDRRLAQQDMKLDLQTKLSQVRDQLSQADDELRQQGVEPDALVPTMQQRGTKIVQDLTRQLKYPGSAAQFQADAGDLLTAAVIGARRQGRGLKHARIGVMAGVQNQEDVNTAVFADDPAVRDAALGRLNQRIGELTATGVWSQEKATSETEGILSQIELGRARRNFQNPDLRAGVVDQLLNGQLRHVKPEAQLTLAHSLQGQSDADYKQQRAALEQWWKDQQEATLLDLTQRANKKDLTIAELDQATRDWQLKGTDYERVIKILAEKPAEKASDPATLDRVIADTHGRTPRLTERTLLDLHTQGLLNTADWRSALDRRNATIQHNENEAKSDVERAYAQGKQRIKTALGIPDIIDQAGDPRMLAWSQALEAYDLRAAGARGTEHPAKVSDDLIPRYQTMLGDRVNAEVTKIEALLHYKSMTELEAAKSRIPPGLYESNRRLLLERDRLRKLNQAEADEQAARRAAEAQRRQQGGFLEQLKRLIPSGPPANIER